MPTVRRRRPVSVLARPALAILVAAGATAPSRAGTPPPIVATLTPIAVEPNRADLALDSIVIPGGPVSGTSFVEPGTSLDVTYDPATRMLALDAGLVVGSDVRFVVGGALVQTLDAINVVAVLADPTPPQVGIALDGSFESPLQVLLDLVAVVSVNDGQLVVPFDVQGIPADLDGRLELDEATGTTILWDLAGPITPKTFVVNVGVPIEFTVSGSIVMNLGTVIFSDGFASGDDALWSGVVP